MKRVLIIITLIVMVVLSLSGCVGKYGDWKKVEIGDLGYIKVPNGWECHINGNEIYFTDEGVTEFTPQNTHLGGYIYGENHTPAVSKLFDAETQYEKTDRSQVYSNSTFRGIGKYKIDGVWYEKGYVKLCVTHHRKEIYMIAWDDTVSYNDLGKIAKSYTQETR